MSVTYGSGRMLTVGRFSSIVSRTGSKLVSAHSVKVIVLVGPGCSGVKVVLKVVVMVGI